jgi:hypothetical protein
MQDSVQGESGPINIYLLFHAAALLFYIVQRIAEPELCIFRRCYHTSLYDRILSGASVAPTSQVR